MTTRSALDERTRQLAELANAARGAWLQGHEITALRYMRELVLVADDVTALLERAGVNRRSPLETVPAPSSPAAAGGDEAA